MKEFNYVPQISFVLELVYTAWDIKAFADDVWRDADDMLKAEIRKQWEANRTPTGGHTWNPPEWVEIAEDGIPLPPFKWDENRRAMLRAELDAYYAKIYGLTRDELRYILDPKDVYGPDFPGETFRVLKEKEENQNLREANCMDEVEQRVCEIIMEIGQQGIREGWKSDRIWTEAIKKRIGILGKEKGFYICSSGWSTPDGQGEWLYDLVWLQNEGNYMVRVPLVLECEWGIDIKNIEEDFCKLLVARAEHRIMIFQQKTQGDVNRILDRLDSAIKKFQHTTPRDRYLLIGLDWTSPRGISERLVVA